MSAKDACERKKGGGLLIVENSPDGSNKYRISSYPKQLFKVLDSTDIEGVVEDGRRELEGDGRKIDQLALLLFPSTAQILRSLPLERTC